MKQMIRKIKDIFSIGFWKEYPYRKRFNFIIRIINFSVREQRKNPSTIPVLIINYNRLDYLKELVSFLLERNHQNIVIIDNCSSYPPLLEYYEVIKDRVTIEYMDKNYGHLVFWKNDKLYNKYAGGYYIITDSDIVPNKNLPEDYISVLIKTLDLYSEITKVGFALEINDIPDSFDGKEKVLEWEKQFWEKPLGQEMYLSEIDTTFALYTPRYRYYYYTFYKAVRIGGNFTARHGGWYIDSKNLSEEDIYYIKSADLSNSWKLDDTGKLIDNKLYNNI